DNARLVAAVREALIRSSAACERQRSLDELRARSARLGAREYEVFTLVVRGLLKQAGRQPARHRRKDGEGARRAHNGLDGDQFSGRTGAHGRPPWAENG